MWKTGIHWHMEEGVECTVEMVHGNKGVVVVTESKEDRVEDCTSVFHKVVSCVMEAKAEFCHSIEPEFFLLDSTDEADYLNEDNMFAISEVESILTCPEGRNVIVSVTRNRQMERTKLLCMHKLTHWDSLFPIDFKSVLHCLRDIVKELVDFGLALEIPSSILQAIEVDYPSDIKRRRRELVREWMSSSLDPPCWWHLVKALKLIEKGAIAKEIETKHGTHIHLQNQLFRRENCGIRPDASFLEPFAEVVGSNWSSLACLLSLTSFEIEEVKRKMKGHTQQEHALCMLEMWTESREEATYGHLCRKLKTISLFSCTC